MEENKTLNLEEIISDFYNCGHIPSCDMCKAWNTIHGVKSDGMFDPTFCELLRKNNSKVLDKIEKIL